MSTKSHLFSVSLPTNETGVPDNKKWSRQLHFFCILLLWSIQEVLALFYNTLALFYNTRSMMPLTLSISCASSNWEIGMSYETNLCSNRHSDAAAAKSLQSCPTLCDPIDGSPPGSPVPGILQARTLGWVAISFSNRHSVTTKWLQTRNRNREQNWFWALLGAI